MPIATTIQTTFDPLTREFVFLRVVKVIGWNIVTIQEAGLASVRLFLFKICQAVSFAQSLEFISQAPVGNLDKVLIVSAADINLLFHARIDTDASPFRLDAQYTS